MFGSNMSSMTFNRLFLFALFLFSLVSLHSAYAVEEVVITGVRPDQMTGLEFQEYLDNQATANQLRALAQYLADAFAKASAEKSKSEQETSQCLRASKIDYQVCLNGAVSYKVKYNGPCHYLKSTVGNIPYGDPAGACYARVLDQFDLYVSNCDLKHAINEARCY
jgi:hypothetical protein